MTLQDAMLSLKEFKLPKWTHTYQYYPAKTGPYYPLVSCEYFVMRDPLFGDVELHTSIDLYPEEVLSNEFETLSFSEK